MCGFTEMAKQVEPHVVLTLLGKLFQRIDALVDSYESLFKVETAGGASCAGVARHWDPRRSLGSCDDRVHLCCCCARAQTPTWWLAT